MTQQYFFILEYQQKKSLTFINFQLFSIYNWYFHLKNKWIITGAIVPRRRIDRGRGYNSYIGEIRKIISNKKNN